MKRIFSLTALATFAAMLASCAGRETVVVHHYPTTTKTRTVKSASVGGGSSPEGFTAVTPPSSYSQ